MEAPPTTPENSDIHPQVAAALQQRANTILQFTVDQRQSAAGIFTLVSTALAERPDIRPFLIPALLQQGGEHATVAQRLQKNFRVA
ncbi:hypothetical protein EXS65_03235 [Candidatus Peribacteria bacterium]|nr:hypothetical protein [Candidatus Peribacteria bacterium]